MTIGTTLNTITVDGNGATTAFTYPFLIPLPSDAVVTFTDANSNATVLFPSLYSITGAGNENGGTVTYPLSGGTPIAAGTFLTIERLLPEIQGTSLSNQGPTFSAIEGALDYLTMLMQQVTNIADRAIVINPADTMLPPPLPIAAVRANQYLAFDSDGNPTAATPAGVGIPISVDMQPVVEAATTALALMALSQPVFADFGVPAFGVSTSGNQNCIIGQVTQNNPPNTVSFPTGVTGYANVTTQGNTAYGVFGRADLGTPGIGGVALNEFDSFNFAGTWGGTLPPNLGIGTPDHNCIAGLFACYGDFPSLMGVAVMYGGVQQFQYGAYFHPFASISTQLILDATATEGPNDAGAIIRSKNNVPNLILQTKGGGVGANGVFEVQRDDGTVMAYVNQQGDFVNGGITSGADGILKFTMPTVAASATGGGATLPANPVGFIEVAISGIIRKIPYYAV